MVEKHTKLIERHAILEAQHDGWRCDRAAAALFSDFSRVRLRGWIESGSLRADGKTCAPRQLLPAGTRLSLRVFMSPSVDDESAWSATDLDLDIVYEDESILVINKRAGMVVHPATSHTEDTMVNALLFRYPKLKQVPRAGIVHRLDKDTSGLLVVAHNTTAYTMLVDALKCGTVRREYQALTLGVLSSDGVIDRPIGRDPKHRMRMAVVVGARHACTRYRVLRAYRAHTHVSLRLETGRTHQIRVHMAHLGHPLLGDTRYGARLQLPAMATPELEQTLRAFKRQALHAVSLGFAHPATNKYCEWHSDLPADMGHLIDVLEHDAILMARQSAP